MVVSCLPASDAGKKTRLRFREGDEFGRWRVVAPDPDSRTNLVCRCACGETGSVSRSNLRLGKSLSCGCLRAELLTGEPSRNRRHATLSPLTYRSWVGMRSRCLDPDDESYSDYGGRGITICRAWAESFDAFVADVGERPGPEYSIDRIDVNGNYEPGNCRWATAETQANNKRNNRIVVVSGRSLTVAQWSRETGIPMNTIYARLNSGWLCADAVRLPRHARYGRSP